MPRSTILAFLLAFGVLGLSALATAMVVSAGPNDQQAQTVDIDLKEWMIAPKVLTFTAGVPVKFNLKNSGTLPHNITISGNGVDVKSANVSAGGTGSFDYTFAKGGAYVFWCSVGNGRHLERGMWSTIQIVDADKRLPAFSLPQPAPLQSAAPAAPANAQIINVDLEEWMINPKVVTVTTGVPVRFVLQNKGNFPHYIELGGGGQGIDIASGAVVSHTTGVFDYTFTQAGGYAVWCPVGNGSHLMRGMISTLYVVAPAGAAPAAPPAAAAAPAAPAAQATAVRPPAAPPTTQAPANLPRTGEAPIGLLVLSSLGALALAGGFALARRREP